MTVTVCVLIWARPGQADELVAYEDAVLQLLPDHGGALWQRARTGGADGEPLEVQLIEFADQASFDAYLVDERRVALADWRERAVERTQVLRVELA